MKDKPDVSVVMGVYNGASDLASTIDSVLAQEGVSFEFVIVDDGSTDESPRILEAYARRDARIKIIRQENRGLTLALVRGCAAARGVYLSRQDVGDLSLPGKLAGLFRFIEGHAGAALASCGTRYVGPRGEPLYDVIQDSARATERLVTLDPSEIRGPSHHSSTIFSKALYEQVGGYRAAFYFAQDIDLWVRLAERGKHIVMPEILYEGTISVESISGLYRKEQTALIRLILESARRRRAGANDAAVLEQAATIRPQRRRRRSRLAQAQSLYFIGSCLKQRKAPEAAAYLKQALRAWPLHLRSAAKLLFS